MEEKNNEFTEVGTQSNGFKIWKKPNTDVGGFIYYNEDIGNEGGMPCLYDCFLSIEAMEIILKDRKGLPQSPAPQDKGVMVSEPTDEPQIHIQCDDGENKEEATELVFHKMADGTLFLEIYYKNDFAAKYQMTHYQTTITKEQFEILRKYLINHKTY